MRKKNIKINEDKRHGKESKDNKSYKEKVRHKSARKGTTKTEDR